MLQPRANVTELAISHHLNIGYAGLVSAVNAVGGPLAREHRLCHVLGSCHGRLPMACSDASGDAGSPQNL